MKNYFLNLAATLAVCGLILAPVSLAEAAKGKSGFFSTTRTSSSSKKSSLGSNVVTSNNFSKKFSGNNLKGVSKLNTQSFTKSPVSKFSAGNKLGRNSNLLKNQGMINKNFTKGNSNSNLNNSAFNNATSLRGNLGNQVTNGAKLADIAKNGGLNPAFNGATTSTGSFTNLRGNLTQTNRGAVLDAIKNGSLKPVGGTNGGGNTGSLPGRGNIVTNPGRIADIIKDGGLKPIGGETGGGNTGGNTGIFVTNPHPDLEHERIVVGRDPNEPPVDPNEPPVDINEPHCPDHECEYPFPWFPPIVIDGGHGGGYCPPVSNVTVIEQPVATTVVETVTTPTQAASSVDLELLHLALVDPGDAARNLGPRYRLVFRNRGTLPAGNFQVLLMASRDGQPSANAPAATAEVISLAPGETASADVRLPNLSGLTAMPALIVALDSAAQIDESDEVNNVAILDRAKVETGQPTSLAAGQ